MADGDTQVKSDTTEAPVKTKGDRGKLGKGTHGSRLKSLHRAEGKGMSLKEFARSLGDKNPDAKQWFVNKGPTQKNKDKAAREKNKGAMIRATALASKQARTKKK